jgi:hypothetical protein
MNVLRLPARAAISVFLLLGGGVVMTIAWEFVFPGRIYHCSDSLGFPGFLMPGRWVHEPIAYVDTVNPTPPMSTHDAIKKGWSVAKLWWAWWSMLAVVVMTSLAPIVDCFLRGDPDGEDGPQVR